MLPTVAPAPTRAMPASSSIEILFNASRSTTQPPRTGVAAPVNVVPRPRVVTGTPCRFANSSTTPTSASFRTRTTASGRNGIFALSNEAASSDAESVKTIFPPSRRFNCEVGPAKDIRKTIRRSNAQSNSKLRFADVHRSWPAHGLVGQRACARGLRPPAG